MHHKLVAHNECGSDLQVMSVLLEHLTLQTSKVHINSMALLASNRLRDHQFLFQFLADLFVLQRSSLTQYLPTCQRTWKAVYQIEQPIF